MRPFEYNAMLAETNYQYDTADSTQSLKEPISVTFSQADIITYVLHSLKLHNITLVLSCMSLLKNVHVS